MTIRKSDIINKLSNNYPNFIKRDLRKIVDIFFDELCNALKRNERVELRDIFSIETKIRKSRIARNPKTNERIFIKDRYSILFKTSKTWTKKINE